MKLLGILMSKPTEQRFLDSDGRLEQWPSHRQGKLLVLAYLASKFDPNTIYTEKEVNEILQQWHTFNDWALLRRELFDRGFIDRNRDGTNYRLREIQTSLPDLILVMPSVVRDAPIAVGWLAGDSGRETLRLMGNTEDHNKPTTLGEEQERIRDFITDTEHATWTMLYRSKPVGVVWIDFNATKYLLAPSVHIMIGDSNVRRQGIGGAAIKTVIRLLGEEGRYKKIHSRYLSSNQGSMKLLVKLGFSNDGDKYKDKDGLVWQNLVLDLN
jgi:RimJ/RimL family protein N-acetyltransferase